MSGQHPVVLSFRIPPSMPSLVCLVRRLPNAFGCVTQEIPGIKNGSQNEGFLTSKFLTKNAHSNSLFPENLLFLPTSFSGKLSLQLVKGNETPLGLRSNLGLNERSPLANVAWTENIMRISQRKFDKPPGKIIRQNAV